MRDRVLRIDKGLGRHHVPAFALIAKDHVINHTSWQMRGKKTADLARIIPQMHRMQLGLGQGQSQLLLRFTDGAVLR